MTRGEIGLAQEERWGGRATNEENNTGERERERQEERRGEGGRRKGGEIDERSERERERKRARMGFNKSLLIKMADWSGINGRSAFSSPFNRFNSYMCAYISHVEWNIFPLFFLLSFAMMDNFSYRSRIKIIVTRRSDIRNFSNSFNLNFSFFFFFFQSTYEHIFRITDVSSLTYEKRRKI